MTAKYKNIWLKKVAIKSFAIIVFLCFIFSNNAKADEWWPVTIITCIPEVNYFMVYTDSLHSDVAAGDSKAFREKNKDFEKKYNILTKYNRDIHVCKLKDTNVKYQIDYGPETYASEYAKLKLWIDEKLIVDLKDYDTTATISSFRIDNIKYKYNPSDKEGSIYFGGVNKSNPLTQLNIWISLLDSSIFYPIKDEAIYKFYKESE